MTQAEALAKLRDGGSLPELAEAIGLVASDPASPLTDIMLGLHWKGFVCEQAALALYKRTGQALPSDRSKLLSDLSGWTEMIHRLGLVHPPAVRAW